MKDVEKELKADDVIVRSLHPVPLWLLAADLGAAARLQGLALDVDAGTLTVFANVGEQRPAAGSHGRPRDRA